MKTKRIKFSVNKFSVDAATGTLSNLALITADREARGHGIYIDLDTLKGGFESVQERGGQLKGVICHETFDQWWNDEDRLLEVPGYFDNISIKGNQLVAGKFEFYESFRSDQPAAFSRLVEMAEKTPNLFGLSIEASGYAVFRDVDGNEYSQRPEDVELMYDGLPVFRIVDLDAAAFVSEPAANDGLFAAAMSAIRGGRKLSKEQAAEIGQAFAAWNSTHGSTHGNTLDSESINALDGQQPTKQTNMEKLLKEIKQRFGKDEARHNRAVLFAVNYDDPDNLTVDMIEAALTKAELDELKASNESLKEQLNGKGEASEQLEKLQQEKAELEKRFEKLKESGKDQDLSIGAPAIVNTGFKFTGKTKALIDQGSLSGDTVDRLSKKFAAKSVSVHDLLDTQLISKGLEKHYEASSEIRTKLAAGTTSIADLWTPEPQVQGGAEFLVQQPSLINSGAVATNPTLQNAASVGGNQLKVESFIEPYFDSLLQVESTAPTLQKITSAQQVASTLKRVSPLAVSSFASAISGSDPWGFILSILSNLRNLQDQKTLINTLRGFLDTAAAALSNDQFSENVDVDGTTGRLITSDLFIDTAAQLGEAKGLLQRGVMIVHSIIEAALLKQDAITTVYDSNGQFVMNTYKNIPLLVSDMVARAGTTSGTVYETYILGPGVIGMGSKPQTNNVGDTASLLIKESEDINDLAVYDRRQFILHPTGAKWTGTPADPNAGPTDAELATGGNWALGVSDVKRCGFVRLRTNG